MSSSNQLRVTGARRPLRGSVTVAGDKSIGHRAIMAGALAAGPVTVRGPGGGEDNRRTLEALRALGVTIEERGPGELVIHGVGLDGLRAPARLIDCGNSGTSIRLLAGLLASRPFTSELSGDVSLNGRPMRRVADPLTLMGARIEGAAGAKAGELYPPLRVTGPASGRLTGIDHTSKVASAQVKSAILLAGLGAEGPTRVREPGPSRDHTERMLAYLGAPIRVAGGLSELDPTGWDRRLEPRPLEVPGDISAAAFPLVAALVVPGSELTVREVGVNPTRTGLLDALAAMGADVVCGAERIACGEPVADVSARAGTLRALTLGGELVVRAIDELPILAVAAAFADGVTTIRDAEELRVKESDRIATTTRELRRFGVEIEERPDGMVIQGGSARVRGPLRCESEGDHRIAMACAVAALAAAGEHSVDIADAGNIATSFPQFVAVMRALGAEVDWR